MPETKRSLKVFLCHAHSDKDNVRALYARLVDNGVDAWLDKEKLLPGQDWELEIRKAVRASDVIVVCLSKQFNQAGFRQKEVRLALDTAMEKPDGEIFIIPARLEVCENLESLNKWHWVDLFEANGHDMLLRALKARADSIGTTLRTRKSSTSKTSSRSLKIEKSIEEDISAASSAYELPAEKRDAGVNVETPGNPSIAAKGPFKLRTEYIVALIGAVATIVAAVISSPWIETWLAPTPTLTATVPTQVQMTPTRPTALSLPSETASPGSEFRRGSTIQHTVTAGETLLQIARCFGVDLEQLLDANPQIRDPRTFLPDMTLIVPNLGSAGEIYEPPCVAHYVVGNEDTWESIASLYDADVIALREINKDGPLEVGQLIVIPSNTAPPRSLPSYSLIPLAPHQEVHFYGTRISPGQVMTIKFTNTASGAFVPLRVDDPEDDALTDSDEILVWGVPIPGSDKYEIVILNKTGSMISYSMEVTLSG